ncbi:MAG: hypothetical protein ABW007_13220 [Chitinophagaceae bacterium]
MKSIRSIVFFIISQDYFQLTPLWKPQILLKQIYTFLITARFGTLRSKPFDLLVAAYLMLSLSLSALQLINYSILTSQFPLMELLKAQYPLFMSFSIFIIYGRKGELSTDLFIKTLFVLVGINILLNVLLFVSGMEEALAASYDIFEFSFNQNIVVFFIFFQASQILLSEDPAKRRRHILLLISALVLINIPNFQRMRFMIILLILVFIYFKQASLKIKLVFPFLFAGGLAILFSTGKFASILEAVVSREDAVDASLAGRFLEIQQILTTDFNPLYGFGFLNARTKEFFFGDAYFHPNDTGLFGVYFNGGYMGLIMFLMLIIISIRELVRFRKAIPDPDITPARMAIRNAAVLMIIFILVNGLVSASFFYEPMYLISYIFLVRRF